MSDDPGLKFTRELDRMNGGVFEAEIRASERKEICDIIDAQLQFHLSAAEEGEKAGAEMPSIRGAAAALAMLRRAIL